MSEYTKRNKTAIQSLNNDNCRIPQIPFADNRENYTKQGKIIDHIKTGTNHKGKETIQRAPVFIPGANGPLHGVSDTFDVSVRDFTDGQRKNVLGNSELGTGDYTLSNVKGYQNHGYSGHVLVAPTTSRSIEAQIDHIVPKNKGGGNTNKNAQILDANSNAGKGDSYPSGKSQYENGARVYIPENDVTLNTGKAPIDHVRLPTDFTINTQCTTGDAIYLNAIHGPINTAVDIILSENATIGGYLMPAGTVIPAGTALFVGESIPTNSYIKSGTVISAGTNFPADTLIGIKTACTMNISPKERLPY